MSLAEFGYSTISPPWRTLFKKSRHAVTEIFIHRAGCDLIFVVSIRAVFPQTQKRGLSGLHGQWRMLHDAPAYFVSTVQKLFMG